jgi:hypothetical protein
MVRQTGLTGTVELCSPAERRGSMEKEAASTPDDRLGERLVDGVDAPSTRLTIRVGWVGWVIWVGWVDWVGWSGA